MGKLYMRKVFFIFLTAVLLWQSASFASYTANEDNAASQYEQATFIPQAPDYNDATMWVTEDGRTCHYADVWNPEHRGRMGDLEINKVAAYMSPGNRFFAPFYRHATIEAWMTQNEDTIRNRTRLSMGDVCAAFDHFQAHRDTSRPLIIAGFSQGGLAVVELLKHIDDETYSQLAAAYWRTDATPAMLHDTITVTVSPERHVLVVSGYSGSEYAAYKGFINVGDIHSCEPWLYSECLAKNIKVRAKEWRKLHEPTVTRIQECGTLQVGTTGDYRPLSFREDDGRYWGFGIEVAGEIARRLGVGIQFVPTSWPTLTADVLIEPQTFDLAIGGITITDARRETMLMSEGYLANGKTILCRASEAGRYQSLADIDKPEVHVMVNPGGLNEKFANENLTHATIIVHQKNEEIPSLIAEGKADVMITEITEAPYYVQTDVRLVAPLLNTPFTHGEIGVLMRKGQEDLLQMVNATIRQMKSDGSLRKLHEKYGLLYAYE